MRFERCDLRAVLLDLKAYRSDVDDGGIQFITERVPKEYEAEDGGVYNSKT